MDDCGDGRQPRRSSEDRWAALFAPYGFGMATPVHSKIITKAAREVLRPLGVAQRGRSRTWLDDHTWWLVMVEFQPSDWAKGAYLNVGAMWLWREQDYFSFDVGYRREGFHEFESEDQFQEVAGTLAARAADEIIRYRDRFPDVESVAAYYRSEPSHAHGFWPSFDAGVACGLAGHVEDAKRYLSSVNSSSDDPDWAVQAAATASEYLQEVEHQRTFQSRIEGVVRKTRSALKLLEAEAISWSSAQPSH